jgi:hypothetical protein
MGCWSTSATPRPTRTTRCARFTPGLQWCAPLKRLGKGILAAHGGRLRARVGIATGVVVVGDLVGAEAAEVGAVTGETPNLAFRLQGLARSGEVVAADRTRSMAGEVFTYEAPEERSLKGFPEPVKLWRVLAPSGAESRFEALHGRWLTPLVGREQELALLLERWRRAKEGEGQVVLVSGEAGIGKSRITEVLRERLMADDHIRLRFQCSPYHTNSALYPIIEHLERAAGFERDDGPEVRLTKLEALMGLAGGNLAEAVPLIAALLGVPTGDRYPPLAMSPERQKERTLATLGDQAILLSETKPVLMIVEDAHWIDPTTQESVDLTIGRAEGARLLVVVTGRPEYRPNWLGRPNATMLVLNRLSKRQGAELVEGVTGGISLPSEVLDQVVAKTDGVPLFVEELTRMVMESGILREQDGRYVLDGPLAAAGDPGDPARQPNGPARSARPGEGGRSGRRRYRPDVPARSSGGGPHALRRGPASRARIAGGRRPGVPPGHGHRRDLHVQARPRPGRCPWQPAQEPAPAPPWPNRCCAGKAVPGGGHRRTRGRRAALRGW